MNERTTSRDWVHSLAEAFRRGDRRALSRLVTCLQNGCDPARILQAVGRPDRHAIKVGLTGSAGVGKSTLAAALIRHLRQANKSVAVVACDPASPLTGGALLGDRVRMQTDAADAGVFIRSLSTRGAGGGLSDSAGAITALLEQFGFDVVLVETIGVGQDQLAARSIVDVLVVVTTPAGGDRIQWQKAGLLEVADVVIVNKAELPGTEAAVASLCEVLGLPSSRWSPPPKRNVAVLPVVATTGQGVPEVWQAVESVTQRVAAPRGAVRSHADRPPTDDGMAGPHPERGFLPDPDPIDRLPDEFRSWEDLGHDLPKLLVAGTVRRTIEQMPLLATSALEHEPHLRRAMLLLSFLGHAHMWGEPTIVDRIPAPLAVPWHEVSSRLGRPPVLSYCSYALDNWKRLAASGPIALGNIVLLQNFLGGVDEEWFILVHVEIEAEAAPALRSLQPAQQAVMRDEPQTLAARLGVVADSIERMHQTLRRMPERCDPYIYFNRVRPYIHGWKEHPALPEGVIYEGVETYRGCPQRFRGETGAQSSIVPALDAALDVAHAADPLQVHLREMRGYMPPAHRAFIEAVERGPSIRGYVLNRGHDVGTLRDAYNTCICRLAGFRTLHLEYAHRYIHSQSQRDAGNPSAVGTGGTPFMPYLEKHRDETLAHQIPD